MSVKPGDVAPDFAGTDLVNNVPWSLYAQKKATVFLPLVAITGPGGDVAAQVLEEIWQEYNGNTVEPFAMAVIGGYVAGGGPNPPTEKQADLQAEIAKAKITFPVILNAPTWKTYTFPDLQTPAWYCLRWNDALGVYVCDSQIFGTLGDAAQLKKKLTDWLDQTNRIKLKGLVIGGGRHQTTLQPQRPVPMPEIMFFLGSPTTDGGGAGVPFGGGRPIPIDPGPFHDVLAGLSVVALASRLSDERSASQMKSAGIATAKAAIGQL